MRMPGSRAMVPTSTSIAAPQTDSLSNRVTTSLRSFNVHAQHCSACVDPYAVHKSPNRQLCDVGHQLAQEIALNLYEKARRTDGGVIEVTFPEGWESVDGLIRAITHKLQGKPSNQVDVAAHDAHRARERVQYVPAAPQRHQTVNRGSAYARDVSHRSDRRVMDPRRTSSLSLVEDAPVSRSRRSPSPKRIESGEREMSSSPRNSGKSVTWNTEVQTKYF